MKRWTHLLWLALAVSGLCGCGAPKVETGVATLEHDKPQDAIHFRSAQRLLEDGTMPDNAVMTAVHQREALVGVGDAAGIYPGGWTWHGPGNVGGRVRSILIHPANNATMWTGGLSGGIWKTTNGGATWAPMDDFLPVLPIGCMALDKSNPNVLYAGTGEGFFETVEGSSNTAAVRGAGIFKSTDGGLTWTQLSATVGANWYFVNRIAINPTNSQILLAATGSGVWRSTNGGQSWSLVTPGIAYDVQFHPTDGQKAVAGFHDSGVMFTTNGGVTWTASTGLGTRHRSEVRYARLSPSTVYCASADAGFIKVYRSLDGGASFSLMTTGAGIANYEAYNDVLWVDPVNANTIVVGGVFLWRSTDSGATFTQFYTNIHADMHAIVEDPSYNGLSNRRVFFGTDGGIFRVNDSQVNSSTALNNNLGITQFYGAVMNAATGQIMAGAQDNGTVRATNNPQGWSTVFGGDGVYCEYDPTNANYWYGGVYYAQIFRSTTGGTSGQYIYSGIGDAGNAATCNFIPFMVLDPNNANRFLIGARSLWRSDNVKAATPTWSLIKPTIQPGDSSGGGKGADQAHFAENPPWNISTFQIAQGNSDLIWVGYNNGEVWKTTNGTAANPSWTRVDNGSTQLPARWVGSIRIDPNNLNRVYVSFMGYASDNLWRTTDGGATWTEISGALPTAPISAVTTHPTNSNWIYVGTDVGLFTSSDFGATWTTANQGPAIVPIEELRWPTPTKLLAVTHGRGVYSADIPNGLDEPLAPLNYAILVGNYVSGRMNELYSSDNAYLTVQGEFVNGDFEYPVGVRFNFESPADALSAISVKLESQANEPNLGQKIRLWNYQTSDWETIDNRFSSLTDSIAIGTATGSMARFIQPGGRLIQCLVTYEPSASESTNVWSAKFDQVLLTVRQ